VSISLIIAGVVQIIQEMAIEMDQHSRKVCGFVARFSASRSASRSP
jgi:hypothetical protein